jgi:GMP synthase-like glutamine amidotransferase
MTTQSEGRRPLVAVLQHIECEGLGSLEPVLAESLDLLVLPAYAGVRPYRSRVGELLANGGFDAVLALGGPMSVYERSETEYLEDSLRLIRAGLRQGLPILGICLGSQLLAFALEAQVVPGRTLGLRKEIGWFPVHLTERGLVDPAFHGFRSGQPVFHWHGDTFTLPAGAWHLARSGLYPNQAFRWGRWAYGLQFHLEVTAGMVARWVEVYSDELDRLDYVDRAAIIEQAASEAERLAERTAVLGRHWADCVLISTRELAGVGR